MIKNIFLAAIATSIFSISTLSAEAYVVSTYGQIIQSDPGVIVSKQWVQYRRNCGNAQGAGTAIGAVTGGVVGSTIGRGSGHIAGALGGAVLGGILGNSVGRNIDRENTCYAIEYTVRLANGTLITLLEGTDVNLPQGQNVLVERSNDGRTFLIPQ